MQQVYSQYMSIFIATFKNDDIHKKKRFKLVLSQARAKSQCVTLLPANHVVSSRHRIVSSTSLPQTLPAQSELYFPTSMSNYDSNPDGSEDMDAGDENEGCGYQPPCDQIC